MILNWTKVVARPNITIRQSLELMDSGSLGVLLIADKGNKLLGLVTDGDVRRGLLKGFGLSHRIDQVMNRSPIVADFEATREQLTSTMLKHQILSIPLIKNSKLCGLETLAHSREVELINNPVFLMAGGFGKRLSPLTDNCPKPLLKIGDKPILELILERFIEAGFHNFYISLHYLPDKIIEYFGDGSEWKVSIKYVLEENPLGTGGALSLLPDNLSALPLVMMNGDILTTINFRRLLDFHNQENSAATMCVREYNLEIPYGVVTGDGKKIVSMKEKPIQTFFVNSGIYVINSEVREKAAKNDYIDMPTLLEKCMGDGKNINMFPIYEYWLDIGRHEDFIKANRDIALLQDKK